MPVPGSVAQYVTRTGTLVDTHCPPTTNAQPGTAATGMTEFRATVSRTVALSVPPFPSDTVYVNVSVPTLQPAGWYATPVPPPVIVTRPLAPWVTLTTDSVSPGSALRSFARTSMALAGPSA